MNFRMIANITAKIVSMVAVFMLPALLISAFCHETESVIAFAVTIAIMLAVGIPVSVITPKKKEIFARDGLVTVGFAWLLVSLFGGLPFLISGAIPSFIDCFFETASGFTTTGATILTEIESLPKGILYWRSFTHWLGGMGVLAFVLMLDSLTEKNSGESMHLLRAESPGVKITKLVPRMKQSASILYAIYIALTLFEALFLLLGRVPLFDSVTIALGTAGTGGFAIKNDSIASYSAYAQWVVTIFMLLFGVNFNIYFLLLLRKFKKAASNHELHVYFGFVAVATVAIVINTASYYNSFGENLRTTMFQVAAIISTTGFCTTNFDLWPEFSKTIMVLLMFCGGMAGSTGGGAKIIRISLFFKTARRSIYKAFHPNSVELIHMDGEIVDEDTVNSVSAYFLTYFAILAVGTLLISLDGMSFSTNTTAMISCLNNVGPGLDGVGAVMNYSAYSGFSKIVLSIVMLIGRLEIYPILVMAYPEAWRK